MLGGGQGEAGDGDAEPLGEARGGGAVAAADVDQMLAGLGHEPPADQIGERVGGLGGAFASRGPQAVMDMLAPDRAVDGIELVIMAGDVGGAGGRVGDDHEISCRNFRPMVNEINTIFVS